MPGLAYHVTQRGTNGQRVFFSDPDRVACLRLPAANREQAGGRILAWRLMGTHVHLVVVSRPTRWRRCFAASMAAMGR